MLEIDKLIEIAYQQFDEDNKGFFSVEDMKKVMQNLGNHDVEQILEEVD